MKKSIKKITEKAERLLELGGIKKDIVFLVISGAAVICSLLKFQPFPFNTAWVAIILCGVPIVAEAVIGLITEFDIKADVLVSLALIASVCIGEDFAAGDRIRVLPGESVSVDGIIVSGQTSVNQAVMTGESLPIDKTVGDSVSSDTVNQFCAFEMEATRVGEDSSIQRMIRLVQSADAQEAKIVGIADRRATWIVVIALTAAAFT